MNSVNSQLPSVKYSATTIQSAYQNQMYLSCVFRLASRCLILPILNSVTQRLYLFSILSFYRDLSYSSYCLIHLLLCIIDNSACNSLQSSTLVNSTSSSLCTSSMNDHLSKTIMQNSPSTPDKHTN